MCQKYNGWSDHATWCLSMMVDGNYNQGDYDYWRETVNELAQNADDEDEHARMVTDALSDWYDSAVDELGIAGFFRDMMANPEFWEVGESLVRGWREEGGKYASEDEGEEDLTPDDDDRDNGDGGYMVD